MLAHIEKREISRRIRISGQNWLKRNIQGEKRKKRGCFDNWRFQKLKNLRTFALATSARFNRQNKSIVTLFSGDSFGWV